MAGIRYALVKGEQAVLLPAERACESAGYHLAMGQGGPTGALKGGALDGSDLFGVVRIARDLGPLAEHAVKALRAEGQRVARVHVGESWDPFLGPLEVHGPVLEAIERIAAANVDVQIRTRAALNRSVAERLAQFKDRITVEIPFVSMRPDIATVWEPQAATPGERLRATRRLTARGMRVSARVDPMLPLLNDTQADIEEFCVAFAGTGMYRVTLSYLQLTPERAKAMSGALSRMHRDVLKGCFVDQPWQKDADKKSFKALQPELRERGLRRFVDEAQRNGLVARICACTDGDVLAGGCHDVQSSARAARSRDRDAARDQSQLDFFGVRALATR